MPVPCGWKPTRLDRVTNFGAPAVRDSQSGSVITIAEIALRLRA
jgi:hypothetical protein